MTQQARKTRRKDRAREAFMLLMLSVVLVFGFGLIVGKQETSNLQQAQAVPKTSAEETTPEPVTEAVAVNAQPETETVPEFHQATSFRSADSQIYLRVNHTKQLNLICDPSVNLSEAIYGVSDENIAVVDEFGMITGVSRGKCTVSVFCGTETLRIPVTVRELTIRDGCTYVDDILIANKSISLPEDYDPGMLPETAEAFKKLQEAAAELGLNIYQGSGYRSYQYQITCYNSLVAAYGEEYANHISAKPGHSEHQTGYTVDCNTINETFINTPEGQWLDKHCHEYGFIIRYPEGKEDITGYDYECWHIRYVGVEVATEIYEQGLTLEEYLDVTDVSNHYDEENESAPSETLETVSGGELQNSYEENSDYPEETAYSEIPAYTEMLPSEPVYAETQYISTLPAETSAPVQNYQEVIPDDGEEFIDAPLIAP
ncbi:MAG: D-alanyl-D-alanine carboxypeptidase family protein [Oscillospiraceae bacterium]|nr:D-alanyl-D-alanine carboxypeptidase family protein [Oscillospiraceae bacterium]